MTPVPSDEALAMRLAALLSRGTWMSCGLLGVGMLLPKTHLVTAGVILLIALPILRVAVMGLWFLRAREIDFALVAALVLAIVVVSTLLGVGGA